VVHFDGLNISDDVDWGESDAHVWLKDSGFDSSDWDRSDSSDLVDILQRESQWLFCWSLGWVDGVQGLDEGWSLVPGEVGGFLQHVVSVPSGNGDEWDVGWVVPDLLQEVAQFSLDLLISGFGPVDGLLVHLVTTDDHLFDSQSEGQQGVFSGLSVFGDSGFEFS